MGGGQSTQDGPSRSQSWSIIFAMARQETCEDRSPWSTVDRRAKSGPVLYKLEEQKLEIGVRSQGAFPVFPAQSGPPFFCSQETKNFSQIDCF
jgi:hypothetical protein